jgi:hypothetical protein
MNHSGSAYGLWGLAIVESAFFIIFAFSFTRPKTRTDWRSFGAFSAFIVALFADQCHSHRQSPTKKSER